MVGPKLPKRAEAGIVIGGYELVRRIGRGGMAEVWVARKALGKKGSKFVAVKLIADHYVGDERYARMFRAEAELAAVLSHANIVQVFDEGEDDGRSYLVMEWVDGLNLLKLGDMLALLDDEKRRFRVISYIIGQLLHALHYAHSITSHDGSPLGVVHRDVSPQNVLVSNHGEVKLTDFGVAYYNIEESSGLHVKGKVRYMSPEQLSGHTRSPTVDLYAVGALLHELLDGKKFRGEFEDGQDLFSVVLSGHVPPVSRPAPPDLDHLRMMLLDPDPAQRIQTAEQALGWLERFPGYGDARSELTKLCGSLTGVVKPRVGPGQSSQVAAADQATTRWGGRQALAKPKVEPVAPPPPPTAERVRAALPTSSTTAVKSPGEVPSSASALITGHTELIDRSALLAASTPANSLSAPTAPLPASPIPVQGSPYASPVPSLPAAVEPAPVWIDPGDLRIPPTQRLAPTEASGAAAAPAGTEVIDASMIVEVSSGSGTEQEILPPKVAGDGTDTRRDVRGGMPVQSNSVSIVLPRRSAVVGLGLGLVLVAVMSVSVTWLLFTRGQGERAPIDAAAPAGASLVDATSVGAKAEPQLQPPTAPMPIVAASGATAPPGSDGSPEGPAPAALLAATEIPAEPGSKEDDGTSVAFEDGTAAQGSTALEPKPKPKPKPAWVKVRSSTGLEKAQVKVGSQIFGVNDKVEHTIASGRKTMKWRKASSEAWQPADSWMFKPNQHYVVHINKKMPTVITAR